MTGFGYVLMLFVFVLLCLVVLLIGGAVALAICFSRYRTSARGGALAILDERYARGELSREEHEQMRDELRE